MIQDVEDIRPDFTADPFSELHLLEDRAVEVPVARPVNQTVALHVAERGVQKIRVVLAGDARRWSREDRRVEIGLSRSDSRFKNLWRAGGVRTLCVAGSMQGGPGRGEVERRSRSGVENARQLPPVERPFDEPMRFGGEGNWPDEARREGVRPVEIGAAMAQLDVGGRADCALITAREIN